MVNKHTLANCKLVQLHNKYEKLPQTIAILCYPESIRIIIGPCRSVENFHFHLPHAMSTFMYTYQNIKHCMRPTEELSSNNCSNCNINRSNNRNIHRHKNCALHYLGVERKKKCRKWLHAACNRIFYESGLVRKATTTPTNMLMFSHIRGTNKSA